MSRSTSLILLPLLFASPCAFAELQSEPQSLDQEADSFDEGEVNEVVVVGNNKAAGSSVSRVTEEMMERQNAQTLPEAVSQLPGVETSSHPKAGDAIQIRGFDRTQVLILMDDIPITEVYSGSFDLSSLLVSGLSSVEVDRGVSSVLHGPNSMGGVVHMHSKTPVKPLELKFQGYLGNFANLDDHPMNEKGVSGQVSSLLKTDNAGSFALFASAGYSKSDGWQLSHDWKPTKDNMEYCGNGRGGSNCKAGALRVGSDSEKLTLHAKAAWIPREGSEVALHYHHFMQDRGVPIMQSYGYTRFWRFTDYDTDLYGITLKFTPKSPRSTWAFTGVRAVASYMDHKDTISDYQDDSYSDLTKNTLAWFVKSSYDNYTFSSAVTASFNLWTSNELELSARYRKDENKQHDIPVRADSINKTYAPWDIYQSSLYTVALEDSQRFGVFRWVNGYSWSGHTLDKEEKSHLDFLTDDRVLGAHDYRSMLEAFLPYDVRLFAAFGHKTRFPFLKELYSKAVGGNADLKPEDAYMYELGADVESLFGLQDKWTLRLFYNDVQNLIDKVDRYENVAESTMAGVEFSGSLAFAKYFRTQGNFTWLYAHNDTEDRVLDYRSPYSAALSIHYDAPFGLALSLNGQWFSGQEGLRLDALPVKREKIDGFFLLGAYARQEFSLKKLGVNNDSTAYLFARAQNLLDADYNQGGYFPHPGRQVMVGLGFEL